MTTQKGEHMIHTLAVAAFLVAAAVTLIAGYLAVRETGRVGREQERASHGTGER